MKKTVLHRSLSFCILASFVATSVMPPQAFAQALNLPAPGAMVGPSATFEPVLMKGLKVHPENPLLFDFILDSGKTELKSDSPELRAESQKLIKYFLASLTIKEDDLWVNLSPYEKDRMLTDELGKTELGRDMLAQDYILKQLTASLIYPEKELGKSFWERIYTRAREEFGTTDIPVDTFNKVWITADKAKVYEHGDTAYIVDAHLKVMLDQDYLAASQASAVTGQQNDTLPRSGVAATAGRAGEGASAADLSKQILREIVIPILEQEVNEGANFAPVRQMFYSMIMASWYKLALKDALLNQVYSNKSKTGGVLTDDPAVKEKIYEQYLAAYKKGVFNYIKEEPDAVSQQAVPHKYFSGGLKVFTGDPAQIIERVRELSAGIRAAIAKETGRTLLASVKVAGSMGTPSTFVKALIDLGIQYQQEGNYWRAEEKFLQAVAHDDRNAFVHASLGMVYKDLNNLTKAIAELRLARDLDPAYGAELQTLLGIQAILSGDFIEAERSLRAAQQSPKTYAPAFAYRGVALYAQGRRQEALNMYQRALLFDPENKEIGGQVAKLSRPTLSARFAAFMRSIRRTEPQADAAMALTSSMVQRLEGKTVRLGEESVSGVRFARALSNLGDKLKNGMAVEGPMFRKYLAMAFFGKGGPDLEDKLFIALVGHVPLSIYAALDPASSKARHQFRLLSFQNTKSNLVLLLDSWQYLTDLISSALLHSNGRSELQFEDLYSMALNRLENIGLRAARRDSQREAYRGRYSIDGKTLQMVFHGKQGVYDLRPHTKDILPMIGLLKLPAAKDNAQTVRNTFVVIDDDPAAGKLAAALIRKSDPQADVLVFTDPVAGLAKLQGMSEEEKAKLAGVYCDTEMPLPTDDDVSPAAQEIRRSLEGKSTGLGKLGPVGLAIAQFVEDKLSPLVDYFPKSGGIGRYQARYTEIFEGSARSVRMLSGPGELKGMQIRGPEDRSPVPGQNGPVQRKIGDKQQDAAMAPGGIDLNAKKLGLDIEKDGQGVNIKFDPAQVAEFQKGNFTGVQGIILRIVPIVNPLQLLGLETSPTENALAKG